MKNQWCPKCKVGTAVTGTTIHRYRSGAPGVYTVRMVNVLRCGHHEYPPPTPAALIPQQRVTLRDLVACTCPGRNTRSETCSIHGGES